VRSTKRDRQTGVNQEIRDIGLIPDSWPEDSI